MGVYTRPDSKYFWLFLERPHRRGIKERTQILISDENRSLAESVYKKRMRELATMTHFYPNRLKKPREDASGWCYVYFVSDGELIKIGRAVNVLNRLRAMQVSHPKRLTVLATLSAHRSIEGILQQRFRPSRVTREWFRPTPELLALIKDVKLGRDIISGLLDSRPLHATGECAPHH